MAYSKSTKTWKLFESLFLNQPESAYPISLGPMPKGKALNLAVGLNRCHVQYAKEQGMPDEAMLHSAKPKAGENEEYFVEISTNYTRQGLPRPSRTGGDADWMDSIPGLPGSGSAPAQSETRPSQSPAPLSPTDNVEDLLSSLYPLDKEDK